MATPKIPVLIAGGGPVGLTTALELTSRNVPVLLIEKNASTTQHPKMDVTNGRSMELFRRLGLAGRIRDKGVPRENVMDVVWCTRFSEREIARFHYPNVHDARERIRARNDGSQPLEPYMRMSQVVLEPLLRDILMQSPLADVRFGWRLLDFEQDENGVRARIQGPDGEIEEISSEYLLGCDGGNSVVRKSMDIDWEGTFNARRRYMVHFRTPAKEIMRRFGIAWHYRSPEHGHLIAQDDEETFTLHRMLPPGTDENAIDPAAFLCASLGVDIPVHVIQANGWNAHLVVAESYGQGRVWMGGDAVHQYIPMGGYGMNTGVCDAVDMGWKVAAVLAGWGGPRLLESIEAERRPIARENRDWSNYNTRTRQAMIDAYDPAIHEDTPEGEAARNRLSRLVFDVGNSSNEALGVEIGFRYRSSPVICHEDDEPEWRRTEYVPSTWPGVRAPHVFLHDGSAIFDVFGPGFTLLRFVNIDTTEFETAAANRGVPLLVVDIRDDNARKIYERDLVLIRPDQHVAWRGNSPPAEAFTVIDTVRGAK